MKTFLFIRAKRSVDILNQEFGENGWDWRGVRPSDTEYLKGWWFHHEAQRIPFAARDYSLAIPLPVLLTMKKVADAFPAVHFYISNPRTPSGDPFLLATTRDTAGFIIERWDEPRFRQ
jgi:hypothetical protein